MLKSILKLKGVQVLNNKEQKEVNGGRPKCDCANISYCTNVPVEYCFPWIYMKTQK